MVVKSERKSVLVIGLGNFGANVAREMASMGHSVIAIDWDEDLVQAISESIDKAVIGDVTKKSVLESVCTAHFDLAVVSLGDRIDFSALATLYLQELKIDKIYVKVVSNDHAELMKRIGAYQTIFPERDMAIRVAQRMSTPNIVEYLGISPDLGILEYKVTEQVEGKSLVDLNLRRDYSINVIGLKELRSDESHLSPDPTQPLLEGDVLFLLGKTADLESFQKAMKKS